MRPTIPFEETVLIVALPGSALYTAGKKQAYGSNAVPPHEMEHQVRTILLLLITCCDFFSHAEHSFLGHAGVDGESYDYKQIDRLAKLVYPVAQKRISTIDLSYSLEQVRSKEHLDTDYKSNPPPTAKDRQELLGLLNDTSRMMREGRKQLIVAPYEVHDGRLRRHGWIAPKDVRIGDAIANISYCGRVGVLLRPIGSIPELNGRPAFQFIGILWSFGSERRYLNDFRWSDTRLEKFLIL